MVPFCLVLHQVAHNKIATEAIVVQLFEVNNRQFLPVQIVFHSLTEVVKGEHYAQIVSDVFTA